MSKQVNHWKPMILNCYASAKTKQWFLFCLRKVMLGIPLPPPLPRRKKLCLGFFNFGFNFKMGQWVGVKNKQAFSECFTHFPFHKICCFRVKIQNSIVFRDLFSYFKTLLFILTILHKTLQHPLFYIFTTYIHVSALGPFQ